MGKTWGKIERKFKEERNKKIEPKKRKQPFTGLPKT